MDNSNLKNRTKRFALDVIQFVQSLPRNPVVEVLARQLIRAATSVSANYRAACRARSKRDFINKLSICEEEADESAHWMELLVESGHVGADRYSRLIDEANQLTAIMVASKKTARRGLSL